MSRGEDDLISWDGDLPPRIDPGEYNAVVLWTKPVDRYGNRTLTFQWRLLLPDSHEQIELAGYCNLGPAKHPKIRPGSKLASWQRAIADFTHGTPKRVPTKAFKTFWFRVRVRTVTRNAKGPLHPRDQYSVVDDILSVGGKRSELSADSLPPLDKRATAITGYPSSIPGLGPLKKDALSRCEQCDEPTSFSYRGHALCVTHANKELINRRDK